MKIVPFIACLFLSVATALSAQEVEPEDRLELLANADLAQGWEAVGRLDIRRKGYCTATMIRPNLVLTAAHCLFDADGSPVATERLLFRAGYRYKRSVAIRQVKRTAILPEYQFLPDAPLQSAPYDVALLVLEDPITEAQPLGIAAMPETGAVLTVVSYARERDDAPSLQEDCSLRHRSNGLIYTDCLADFGASGSPLFYENGSGPKIIGVISAKGEYAGTPVAIGAEAVAGLLSLLDSINE